MKQLFTSATIRLTAWYIIILAGISLLFSVLVYQISTDEVERRLLRYENKSWSTLDLSPASDILDIVRSTELAESKAAVVVTLTNINIIVLLGGGALSYLLARRTLRPIQEAHETQARFVSDASHELRTPLATMTTELEVTLSDTAATKQDLRDTLTSNLEEVKRLTELSSTLLALSSGSATSLLLEPFDIHTTLTQVTERFARSGAAVELKTPKAPLVTVGNQASIEELVTILLTNAVKYGTPDTPIEVRLKRQATGRALISVTNHGEGISQEHIPHIFDRFYRADESRTDHDGHGLGLSLAKQIVDLHNTEIVVKSQPQKTTTFSFTLPLKKPTLHKKPR